MNKIQIIKPHSSYGWVTARVCGRWVQAKVYDTPSIYGINGGRISKLFVGKTSALEAGGDFFSKMDYSYDRGLDFNYLPQELLHEIVGELEKLPKLFDSN
jgi:hypothetical protein